MYPLDAILIGCDDQALPTLRRELVKNHVNLQGEHVGVSRLLASLGSEGEWTGKEARRGDKTRLFLLYLKSSRDLHDLRTLSAAMPGQPILALLAAGGGQDFLIAAMREGASQVVVLPLQPDDFKGALDRIGVQHGHTVSDCLTIAVTGVTGGSGATTLAVNLAFEVAHRYEGRCILVELALQMGVLPSYLNLEPTFTTQDLLQEIDKLGVYSMEKALTPVGERLRVLTGPYKDIGAATAKTRDVLKIIEAARRLADVVVLDVPSSYDDLFFHSLACGDEVVLVGEQKVPSIRALALLTRTLAKEAGIAAPHLVINRYDPKVEGFTVADLEKLLGGGRIWTIANDYAAVMSAVNAGQPLRQAAAKSRVLADVGRLADALVDHQDEAEGSTADWSVFGKLIHAFGLK